MDKDQAHKFQGFIKDGIPDGYGIDQTDQGIYEVICCFEITV